MRAMSLAAIATLWIATASISASAADQVITESFTVTIPSSTVPNVAQGNAQFESTPFPLFAASTGLIKSVSFSVTGSVRVVSLNADPDVIMSLVGQESGSIIGFGQDVKGGMTSVMFSGDDHPTGNYVGSGNTQVQITLNTSDLPNTDLIESIGPLEGSVTYTYTQRTLAGIPEPSTWAMMLVGFASLGFAGYRTSRRAPTRT
jgi:hypothetical protein